MKIAVVGSRGNLGQQLIRVFSRSSGNEVVQLTSRDMDITDEKQVLEVMDRIKPHLIINAAAYNAVDKCEETDAEFQTAKRVNGEGPGWLAAAARNNGAAFIHYSTDYVFHGDCREGYKEDDAPDPISNYGASKLLGERRVFEYGASDAPWYVIRTSKLFGPKAASVTSKPSFFDTMLNLSKAHPSLKAVHEETSCFTYTPDLAEASKTLIDENRESGIYHIVNEGPCTWFEAAQELFRLAGLHVQLDPVPGSAFPRPAKRPAFSVLLNTKTRPLRAYQDALKEYLELPPVNRSE